MRLCLRDLMPLCGTDDESIAARGRVLDEALGEGAIHN